MLINSNILGLARKKAVKRAMMLKQVILSAILLFGFLASSATAQQSAQASMKVSVEVVEGASIAMSQPDKVNLAESGSSILGAMQLQGSDNTVVEVSDKLQLFDSNGNQINLNITAVNDIKTNADNIRFQGLQPENNPERGSYSGELKATVEYL
jgi:ABC-type transport system substrate-binding protein